ncbi:MAG TPA: radical SAM protein [Dissulfurispiraceae bacterium]|nr:radical SAM protein [Dissulfurispiraceae bacterium]
MIVDMLHVPAYLCLPPDELQARAGIADAKLESCTLCPRKCGVNRKKKEIGFCGIADAAKASSWGPHFGEERLLVGRFGSGTVFLSGCNLGCIFCQNWSISHDREGKTLTDRQLAGVMLDLQAVGCHNINLVTPTHQTAAILRALVLAVDGGLTLPLVYNCGGYESIETLQLLDGVVDIYMPDVKFMDPAHAARYARAGDYPAVVRTALLEMHRQVGDMRIDSSGIARRGLLVRHLVMPGGIAGTEAVMRFLADEISVDTYVNVMDQYHPCHKACDFPEISRRVTPAEYKNAVRLAMQAGLSRIDGETI